MYSRIYYNRKFILPYLYIKLHNEVHKVLHNKINWLISWCFDFVKQTKNKVYILNWLFKLLVERFH